MFEINFNKITVSKANRYVILIKNSSETKRTQICSEWTSNPHFQHIQIDDIGNIEVKLCEASLDRKIRIVGVARLEQEKLRLGESLVFEGELKLEQEVEGSKICVGLIYLTISKRKEFSELEDTEVPHYFSQLGLNQQIDEDYQLKEEDQQNIEENEIQEEFRIQVHCGFNFYLGSEFYVEVQWGKQSFFKTKSVRQKINPVWAEGSRLRGYNIKPIIIRVRDHKGNVLQIFKFTLQSLRILFPYHIRLVFKQQYMGAVPEVYFSLIRQSNARHSILQKPLKFGLKGLGEPVKNATYLVVSLNSKPFVPQFMEIDNGKYVNMQQVNEYLVGRTLGEEERVDIIGLSNGQQQKSLSVFKSYLNRKMYMFLIHIYDQKAFFLNGNWQGCKILESKQQFQSILRKIYYHGQTFSLKKIFQFFNPNIEADVQLGEKSIIERWKLLSRNYVLRNKLVNDSKKHIQELNNSIKDKGKQLVQLKKIMNEIRIVNTSLVSKEKIMNSIRMRAKNNKIYAKQIDTVGLISALYEKQSILQGQKRINSQLSLRMNSLAEVQQNQQDLSKVLLSNAVLLQKQQQNINRMQFMTTAIKKQRLIIGQLQKVFQKSEMDKRVNQALNQQREKLNKIRDKRQQGLKNIYKLVKGNNSSGGTLASKVKQAQQTLIKLNQQYARLTTF